MKGAGGKAEECRKREKKDHTKETRSTGTENGKCGRIQDAGTALLECITRGEKLWHRKSLENRH